MYMYVYMYMYMYMNIYIYICICICICNISRGLRGLASPRPVGLTEEVANRGERLRTHAAGRVDLMGI